VSLPSAIHLGLCLMIGFLMAGCYVEALPVGPEVMSARLVELLTDVDPSMRRTAAEALGKIGRRSARSGLVSALDDPDPRVRGAAAIALGRLGGAEDGPALVKLLSDPVGVVREAGALALSEIEPDAASEAQILAKLQTPNVHGRIAASRALLGLESVSFSANLAAALRDVDPMVRQGLAAVMGETGDVRAIPYLLSLVKTDVHAGVRSEAAFRLGKVGDREVVPDLLKVAETDSDFAVRGWTRWALHQIRQSHESGSKN
jgi:HEAT repeat protein